jgi:adenylate cyclase
LAATSIAALSLLTLLGFWHLSAVSEDLVRRSAVESAAQYSALLEVVNDVYSSEVVARAGHHGVEATADYAARAGAIPLPATLLTVLLVRVSEGPSGMRGSHYSEHPFRSRPDGGPKDAFAKEALDELAQAPFQPFFRFTTDERGEPVLRYATARIMQPSCVSCHNSHPDSTRRDWRVGDVRGALEIVRPLSGDRRRIQDLLRATFVLAGSVALGLLGLTMLGLGVGQWRRRALAKRRES